MTPVKPTLELIHFFTTYNYFLLPPDARYNFETAVGIHNYILNEMNTHDVGAVCAEEMPQLFRSLTAMEERLDPRNFFRANRKQVINLTWVEGIEPWFSGGLLVKLKGGPKVELSRRQAQDFRERMSL